MRKRAGKEFCLFREVGRTRKNPQATEGLGLKRKPGRTRTLKSMPPLAFLLPALYLIQVCSPLSKFKSKGSDNLTSNPLAAHLTCIEEIIIAFNCPT